ncbi:FHA domain-containing protein [Falsirhodobacter sp. 1013]|uniref:FHA domain-containing protein n=1 Tax=Falsirhodobacter sp. 1013 TaxID=3417566 RepID=UPI003EBFA871
MFANLPERNMLTVRGLLLAGWLILIGSLLWDPFSAALTEATNAGSPFRVGHEAVPVQGVSVTSDPYPMGARIFWTMIVPILPLFLMVFGHEAWRRICPLSFASQIPGYLGLTRGRARLDRRTGTLDRVVALVERDSWLARHAWYVQFGLLFAGITARLLLINSDRYALAGALLAVIGAAMLTGVLWGGKTWCNYFCPANIVQKIYTEPRGLLESAPHLTRPALPQSMCRKPTPQGDRSGCVGCTVNCGDIDLERSYWQGIENPHRRNTYYMFLGLIIGFYGYYYVYSGSWRYYFSGVWTHEANLRDRILGPGVYLSGEALAIPKLVAAPLTLALACATTLALGRGLEALYRRFRRGQRGYTEAIVMNHCLSVSAWASINTFYLFGGRPNLSLLPTAGVRVVDLLIIALTTLWLRQVLARTPDRYERESMSSRLLDQLRRMRIDISRVLGGRSIDDLKPDEVFVLSKVLPVVSHEERVSAYRNVLGQAVSEGGTASAGTLKMLDELRVQMDLTEEEHTRIVEELGVTQAFEASRAPVTEEERRESWDTYRDMLGNLVASRVASGRSMDENLADPEFQQMTRILRDSLQIDERGHLSALAHLAEPDGALGRMLQAALDKLIAERGFQFALATADIRDPLGAALVELLADRLGQRESDLCDSALRLLRIFGNSPIAEEHARALRAVTGKSILARLEARGPGDQPWHAAMEPEILSILKGAGAEGTRPASRQVLLAGLDAAANLEQLAVDDDPLTAALALAALALVDRPAAQQVAENLLNATTPPRDPLLRSVVDRLADIAPDAAGAPELRLRLRLDTKTEDLVTAGRTRLSIGSSFDNDIVVPEASAYHAVLRLDDGAIRLQRLDVADIFVNGRAVEDETPPLDSGVRIGFGADAPMIELTWESDAMGGDRMGIEPVMRLAMLGGNAALRRLPLERLAALATASTVRRHGAHARILSQGRPSAFLIHSGSIRLFDPTAMRFDPAVFGQGDIVPAALATPDAPLLPEVSGGFAILVHLPQAAEVDAAAPPPPRAVPAGPRSAAERLEPAFDTL